MKIKRLVLIITLFAWSYLSTTAKNSFQDPTYYFGQAPLNSAITTPEEFFGFPIGSALVRYDKVVEYFKLLGQESDRASLVLFGHSWQHREQVKLIVSSPGNQNNLESIRLEHLKLINPEQNADLEQQKIIVELAYNIHGGEISGTDAAVLSAYYLVASLENDIRKRLEEAVILIEPAQNPDGRERAATHINGFHSWPAIADPADIEHGSSISPHRGNHFWNDLNRDWLPLSQIESKNRVAYYHEWYPNVYLDFHEMGSGSSYYFEPSPLSTWNKILPPETYTVLNEKLAIAFSAALNSVGSLFYTKESFTNLSPIYGSTYPDYQGGVGVTLEVGSTSGIQIQTAAGLRTFAQNLRDNFLVGIAGFRAATDDKLVFLKHQQDFFKSALKQAEAQPVKHIVFGNKLDASLNKLFLDHLLAHRIEVFELAESITLDGKIFETGSSYVVPLRQGQFRILQSIFEENETNNFDENTTFYDISSWSTVHGYGIPFSKARSLLKTGPQVLESLRIDGTVQGEASLAYAFEFHDYLAPKALYYLLEKGIQARVTGQPFTSRTTGGEISFSAGSIVVPIAYQSLSKIEIAGFIEAAIQQTGIKVYGLNNGFSVRGIDLGSNQIRVLKVPVVATITSGNWTSLGEVWALLGQTHGIPLVKLTPQSAENADLSKYTSLILQAAPATPQLEDKILAWLENGGTLIAQSAAVEWANALKPGKAEKRDQATNPRLNGIIVGGELNLDHPLTYGFTAQAFPVLKTSRKGLELDGPEQVVLKTNTQGLINGYATEAVLDDVQGQSVVGTFTKGRGHVVLFGVSPAFRGYWLAPGRLLTNALFFLSPQSGQGRF